MRWENNASNKSEIRNFSGMMPGFVLHSIGGKVNRYKQILEDSMTASYKHIETKLIHSGEPEPRIGGAVVMPIFQTAMFEYEGEACYEAVRYLRLNNTPNQLALGRKLAALENAEAALVTSSGMAAISTTLLALLSSGDHLLAQDCLYGGTHDFLTRDFASFGLSFDFMTADDPQSWHKRLRPTTKAIYVESFTNPLLQAIDLREVVRFAREHGLITIVDNTFPSPYNFRPPEWGFDLSIHSATKYLNGHSDLVAGAVIGRAKLVEKITYKLNHLGGSLDSHAAFLLHRGLKTLGVRMRHQNDSALRIAEFLEQHPSVSRVNYPGLKSHPAFRRVQEMFNGTSGMLSFELKGGVEAAERFMANVQLPLIAPSLGGVETLMTRPATTSHSGMVPEERRKLGISDGLIRVSIGLENTAELIEDFSQSLELLEDLAG